MNIWDVYSMTREEFFGEDDMSPKKLKDILDMIHLAPWYRDVEWVVEDMPYADFPGSTLPTARFRLEYDEPDTDTGATERQSGRWWYVEKGFHVDAIIKSAWLALTVSDEHRRREGFRVGEKLMFSPHTPLPWHAPEGAHA